MYVDIPPPQDEECITIRTGTPEAEKIGFSKNLFFGVLYLVGDTIIVAYVRSLNKRAGNVKRFFRSLNSQGYNVEVVDCCPEMVSLCESMLMDYRFAYLSPFGEPKEYYRSPAINKTI